MSSELLSKARNMGFSIPIYKAVTSRQPKVLTGVSQAVGHFPQRQSKHDWALVGCSFSGGPRLRSNLTLVPYFHNNSMKHQESYLEIDKDPSSLGQVMNDVHFTGRTAGDSYRGRQPSELWPIKSSTALTGVEMADSVPNTPVLSLMEPSAIGVGPG